MAPMLALQRLIKPRQASVTSLACRGYGSYPQLKASLPGQLPEGKPWKSWKVEKTPGALKEEIKDLPVGINLEISAKCSPIASRKTLFKSKHTLKDIQHGVGVIETLVQKCSEMSTKGPLSLLVRMLKEF